MVGIWKELSGSFIFKYDGYIFFKCQLQQQIDKKNG